MKKPNIGRARYLRRNGSDAETLLWRHLRNRQIDGCKFRRQEPRSRFIADFVCIERKLIVEVDGGQHGVRTDADVRRSALLAREGFRVVRFWNNDVLTNIEGVVFRIHEALQESHPDPRGTPPHPTLSPRGEG